MTQQMSIQITPIDFLDGGPELSLLGKRIELLRIDRGMSKQSLARRAGTSRQQLWRVMTGKSELTSSLCLRLADVLSADPRSLRDPQVAVQPLTLIDGLPAPRPPAGLSEWLADADHLVRTLGLLPGGAAGRALRLALLDVIEQQAHAAAVPLPHHVGELRRRVSLG